MTKKILSSATIIIMVFVISISTLTTKTNAAEASIEDIQAAQQQALESAKKAQAIADQTKLQLDPNIYKVNPVTTQVDQATTQAKQAATEATKTTVPQTTATPQPTTSIIARCETITTNIEAQITRFEEGKSPKTEKFQIVATNLSDLIKKLKDQKIDTKNLESQLTVLDGKIKNYSTIQDDYSSNILSTKSYACTKPENDFKSSLTKSQNSLKNVKESAKDLQDYVQKTIRPEVQKFRDQIK
jgi:hypothetical protein